MTDSAPSRENTGRLLQEAWARSDWIFDLIDPGAILARPIPLRQPFLFYVGHLPAFAWNHLWRGGLGQPAFNAGYDALFERGIDPPDDDEAPADDPDAWPLVDDVRAYRDRVREELGRILDAPEAREILPMVLEHELMHHETLLYMVHQLPAEAKARPEGWSPPAAVAASPKQRVLVPHGRAVLGTPRAGVFRWDNEHLEHKVEVPDFVIDSTPVTNRDFLTFVERGGYHERRLWTDDAWRWLRRRGSTRPPFWAETKKGRRVKALFDEVPFEEAADWPVYVTHCEATAFAAWRGAHLPSEAEFHRAAFGAPDGATHAYPWGEAAPGPEHGNLGFRLWGPTPVGAHPEGQSAFGVHELVGNGWEWTSTAFGPFPGFTPLPRYPGYSAAFFDGRHFVMLGGSWATDPRLVRRSFRNWFQPHYPYVFAKFRCAGPV